MVGKVAPFRVKRGSHDESLPLPHCLRIQHRITILKEQQRARDAVASHAQVLLHLGQVGLLRHIENDIAEELMPQSQILSYCCISVKFHDRESEFIHQERVVFRITLRRKHQQSCTISDTIQQCLLQSLVDVSTLVDNNELGL